MNESEYWYNKTGKDALQSDLQHEQVMNNLITEGEYKLFQMLKPKIYKDGDHWCVLLGENIHEGISGFGKSTYLAILDFNKSFNNF